jgi:hypothetical protein
LGKERDMFDQHRRWMSSKALLAVGVLFLAPAMARSQGAQSAAASNAASSSADLTNEVRALAETVRELQAQVRSLNLQLSELRAKPQSAATDAHPPGTENERLASPTGQLSTDPVGNPYSVFPTGEPVMPGSNLNNAAQHSSATNESLEGRVSKLEDNQQLIDAMVADQNQTKVESGSKYHVRLSGIVLVNLFENHGPVDNADFPAIAAPSSPFESSNAFGGSLRQSQIRLQVFGPEMLGARTNADINFDFAGGFPNTPNGAVMGLPRFRTGTIRLDWANTSIVAGQDFLFFSPLQPTSFASVATPPLSYAGNLWAWTPQVRIEHRIALSETSHLLMEGGFLDSLTGDLPDSQFYRYPSWGEQSGQPAYAGRIAWSHRLFGQDITLGEGAYYGRQFWGFNRDVNGWAATTDLMVPLGSRFTFTGAFYRGAGLGGFGGAIGQDIVLSGSFDSPGTIIKGLDSMGGWAQLKFKPSAKFEFNGAFGQDNPFATQLRKFAATTPAVYGDDLLARNRNSFVNFIYWPKSNILMSIEYLHIRTFELDESYSSNNINLTLGYVF